MVETFAKHKTPRRLSELLAEQRPWSLGDRLGLFRSLVLQVRALHRRGRFHRAVLPDAISVDEQLRPQLLPSAGLERFGGEDWDPQRCPPELARVDVLELPEEIEAARAVLRGRKLSLDPRSIDVYQLGTLLCQLLTDATMLVYLYDPKVKGEIPSVMRPVVQGTLGEGDAERLEDCDGLLSALDEAVRQTDSQSIAKATHETPAKGAAIAPGDDTPPAGAHLATEREFSASFPFQRLGQFRIVAKIGQGGMGDVYKAVDESLHRDVAIKVLPSELTRDQEFVRRFRAEATAVAQLSHPNIVPVYSIGEDSGCHYFAMQFVDGESLADRLVRCRRLPLADTLEIMKQCLAGLQAAHTRGLIHRDIKPGNILLDSRTGLAMLVDFGLVRVISTSTRMTATGVIMGTVDYIAPEQARGEPVDGRADLYALGVLAYEMLAGRLPFEADSAMAMIFQHAYEKPFPLWRAAPDVPRAVVDIIARLMAKRPQNRYLSARSALADIEAFEAGKPICTAPSIDPASRIAEAPLLGDAPELPPSSARYIQPNWWQALRARAQSLFRARAPEFLKELQTTEQHVHGAVAAYQRRHDRLARRVEEAEEIAADLAERKQSYLGAIQRAEGQVATASNNAERELARRDLTHCRQAAIDLQGQEGKLQEELNDLRVRKAQAGAKLLELSNQRDLLQARLKAARARADVTAGRARRQWILRWTIATAELVVVVAGVWGYLWYIGPRGETAGVPSPRAPVAPSPPRVSRPALKPSSPPSSTARRSNTVFALAKDGCMRSLTAHVLHFEEKKVVEFDSLGTNRDWLLKDFTAKLLVRFEGPLPASQPWRLMGNLDTWSEDRPRAGWALLLLPADVPQSPGETVVVDERPRGDPGYTLWQEPGKRLEGSVERFRRLAFAYSTADGRVRRLVGPRFEPADQWCEIAVSRSPKDGRVMIVLAETSYLNEPTEGMLLEPAPAQFWLGAPRLGDAAFSGDVGRFALDQGKYRSAFYQDGHTRVLLDFSRPGDELALDQSGWGNHGKLVNRLSTSRPTWGTSPEWLPMRYSKFAPEPGKAFVLRFGQPESIELLRTQDLVGLDREFTVEMWVDRLVPVGEETLFGNAVETDPAVTGYRDAGWSLVLTVRKVDLGDPPDMDKVQEALAKAGPCFRLEFPASRQSRGGIFSTPFRAPSGWHHLALCNTPSRRQIYLDGKPLIEKEDDQANTVVDNWIPSDRNLRIGKPGAATSHRRDWIQYGRIRAFRVSSTRRYHQEFTPPPKLGRDEDTIVLLDFSHQRGNLVPDLSDNRREGYMAGPSWEEVEKTWED